MERVLINKNDLERYDKDVSKLAFSIKAKSNEQKKFASGLENFLNDYLKNSNFIGNSIDAQNKYFVEKALNDFFALLKEKLLETDSKNAVEKYVENAFDSVSNSKLDDFKKLVENKLNEYGRETDSIETGQKRSNDKSNQSSSSANNVKDKETSKLSRLTQKDQKKIEQITKSNLYIPKLNFDIFKSVLTANVSRELPVISQLFSKAFGIDLEKYYTRTFNRKQFFKKLFIPDITTLRLDYEHLLYERTYGTKFYKKIRLRISKFYEVLNRELNLLFPFRIATRVLKFGIGAVSLAVSKVTKTIKLGISIVKGAFNLIHSSISFVINTIKTIGSSTISILKKTFKKISSFGIVKLTVKIATNFFFKTYVGAYILGFIIGRVVKKLKTLFSIIQNVSERVKAFLKPKIDWLEKNIVKPYIDPVLKWINVKFEEYSDLFRFFASEFESVLRGDNELSDFLDNFKITYDDKTLDIASASRKINSSIRDIEDLIDNTLSVENLKDLVITNTASLATGMAMSYFGSKIGAAIGGAIGTVVFPGIGSSVGAIAGGIIGSLLGGGMGDALGDFLAKHMIKKNAGYNKVESSRTSFMKYSDQNFEVANLDRAITYGEDEGSSIFSSMTALSNFGKRASKITNLSESIILKIDFEDYFKNEIKALESEGINIRVSSIFSNLKNKETRREAIRDISLFNNFSKKLSYENVRKEMNDVINSLNNTIDKSGINGLIMQYQLNNDDYSSELSLSGTFKINRNISGRYINPFFFRLVRAIALNRLKKKFMNREISVDEFLEEYKRLSNSNKLPHSEFKLLDEIKYNGKTLSEEEVRRIIIAEDDKINASNTQAYGINTLKEKYEEMYGKNSAPHRMFALGGSWAANVIGYYIDDNGKEYFSRHPKLQNLNTEDMLKDNEAIEITDNLTGLENAFLAYEHESKKSLEGVDKNNIKQILKSQYGFGYLEKIDQDALNAIVENVIETYKNGNTYHTLTAERIFSDDSFHSSFEASLRKLVDGDKQFNANDVAKSLKNSESNRSFMSLLSTLDANNKKDVEFINGTLIPFLKEVLSDEAKAEQLVGVLIPNWEPQEISKAIGNDITMAENPSY